MVGAIPATTVSARGRRLQARVVPHLHKLGDAYRLGEVVAPKSLCRRFCTVDLRVEHETQRGLHRDRHLGSHPHKDLLLIDLDRDRLEGAGHRARAPCAYEQHHPAQIGVERAGFQLAIIQKAAEPASRSANSSPTPTSTRAPSRPPPGWKVARSPGPQRRPGAKPSKPNSSPSPTGATTTSSTPRLRRSRTRPRHFGEVTTSIATGTIRRPWELDPAEQLAARLGATFYRSK